MNRTVAIGIVGVFAIVLAVALAYWQDVGDDKPLKESVQAPATVSETTGKTSETSAGAGAASETSKDEPEKSGTAVKSAKKEDSVKAPKASPPSFDIVRVNPAGDAVIAGRAQPGASVTVLDGDTVVGTVVSDQNGEWVLVPEKPLPSGNRALSVTASLAGGPVLKSEDVVVLAVPDRPASTEQPLAVLVPRDGKETKRVLQRPRPAPAGRSIKLTLDVVDYDEAGNLRLNGQANPGNQAIVYLNNESIGRSDVSADSAWELRPENPVVPGLYTLRVDEIGDNKVVARIELPFSRAAPLTDLKSEDYVIVQPGNSLWRISRRILGEGTAYTVIYEANKDQIRDVDLIYPGQVFAIPKTN